MAEDEEPESNDVTADDVYRVFGRFNVRRWADMDATEDDELIDDRIDEALRLSTDYVLSSLRRRFIIEPPPPEEGEEVDLQALPNALLSSIIRDIISRIAGMDLNDARGYEGASEGKVDPLQKHRKLAEQRLHSILLGRVTVKEITLRGSATPYVVR